LFFALGLILTTLNCGFAPKSECELTETDGKSILGIAVVPVDKSDEFFGEADNDKNFRGCGYVAKYKADRGNVYWTETKSADLQQAKRFYNLAIEKLPDADDYSVEEITGIGEQAALSRFQHADAKKMEITVRRGRTVFSILISKPSASEIPVEQVKSLAERIAAKTTDY
ncbi:MAG: hypothetical protein ABI891_10325, partial [Acidobacteriota bacterium]